MMIIETYRRLPSLLAKKLFISYFALVIIILGFSFRSYHSFMESKRLKIEAAAYEIEIELSGILSYAESVLNYINNQISSSRYSNVKIARTLSSFNRYYYGHDSIKDTLSTGKFYWIDANNNLIISNSGVSSDPIDLSNRDYLKKTKDTPWKIQSGDPVIGALSGEYVFPVGVGALDKKNRYIGTSGTSFRIYSLVEKFKRSTDFYNVDFAILNNDNKVLIESADGLFSEDEDLIGGLKFFNKTLREEMVSGFSPFDQNGSYVIVRKLEKYPYKILVNCPNSLLIRGLLLEILPRFIELIILTLFFIMAMRSLIVREEGK